MLYQYTLQNHGFQFATKARQRQGDLPLLRQGCGADRLIRAGAGAADHGGNDAEFVVTGTVWSGMDGWHGMTIYLYIQIIFMFINIFINHS